MFVLLKILYFGTLVPLFYSIFIKFQNITLCTRFAAGSKGKNSNNLLYNIKECLVANRLCLLVLYKTVRK